MNSLMNENGNILMPKSMSPSQEEWENLGFVFSEFSNDKLVYNAILPEGWSIEATDNNRWARIIDENGFVRGRIFYKEDIDDRVAFMTLNSRYKVCSVFVNEKSFDKIVYFGNDDEKLFIAGEIHRDSDATKEELYKSFDEEQKLIAITTNYAKQYYPDWSDVNAYWNDENKKNRIRK